jgi:adenine-specific DNA-methyltransferase
MPTLDWIGKKAVINHHRQVPYRLLHCDAELSAGDPDAGNLLVEGDNLEALKSLLPYYAGQVKCIYIDPPYNTGNEGWVYNDRVNSPEIRKWLEKAVGREAEDLSRHDKWLCMMYPRLSLLREFLSEDGAIFVSIDDNEVHNLRLVMDEIFGTRNWVATFVWKRRQTTDSRNISGVSLDHEYVICYGTSSNVRFKGEKKDLSKYKNPDNDPNGPWMSDNLTGLADARERPNLHYDIVNPETGKRYKPHPARGWIYGPDRMMQLITEGRILWPKSSTGRPRLKRFVTDMQNQTTGYSTMLQAKANVAGTKEQRQLFGEKVFAFPKPSDLITTLIDQIADDDSIVLDSFAGSGTTGHAVLEINRADGGNRKFILVEMEPDVCRDVAAQRLQRVVMGYNQVNGDQSKPVDGLGGGFTYCVLGKTLFDDIGNINGSVKFEELAAHVFFTETGVPIPGRNVESPLLGIHEGKAVYLLFNGVMGDRRPHGGNILTGKILAELTPHDGPKVIYGEGCRLSSPRLRREGIVFKQVPYEIKVS